MKSYVFRTALLILSGNAMTSLLLLARNLIVARLITVEDYGIAATFAVVMAIVEMASAFGLQQQIIQSKEGDEPRFQATLHGFQVLRGIAASIALFLISGPVARFLDIPEVIWAYQLLALVPTIKAFEHFDIYRFNRQMRFWPLVMTGGMPAVLSLLLVWPLAAWFGDWRVMLFAILTQISVRTITSHRVAERPYRISFDLPIIRRSLRFGWPILINAILLFAVFQADKVIVGRVLGIEALAIFAMGMTLTTPTLVIQASIQRFFLPQLSQCDRKSSRGDMRFQKMAAVTSETNSLLSIIFVFLVVIFGDAIIEILLDPGFSKLKEIFVLLAILQCIRVLKGGPATISLANGQTENAMLANITRTALLPISYLYVLKTGRLESIIQISILGEFLGFLVATYLLYKRSHINIRPMIASSFFSLLFIFTCIIYSFIDPTQIFWIFFISAFFLACLSVHNLWRYVIKMFQRLG